MSEARSPLSLSRRFEDTPRPAVDPPCRCQLLEANGKMRRRCLPLISCCALLALMLVGTSVQAASPRHKKPTPANPAPSSTETGTTTPAPLRKSTEGQLLDRIVAVVDDGVVLQSELDARVREISTQLSAQNVALPAEATLRSQVLDQLVIEQIESQHADHAGIKVSDEQLNQALEEIARRQNITLEQLPQKLAEDGGDYAQYR